MILVAVTFVACESDIELDAPDHDPKIVVEGNITSDQVPFVILSKTSSFFEETSIQDIENSFVHGANVTVSDGTDTVQLTEYSTDSLPQAVLDYMKDSLGVDLPSDSTNQVTFYFYTDLSFSMVGTEGRTYWLDISTGTDQLSSVTTIPQKAELDSIWWIPHPNPANDTLVSLMTRYSDPGGVENFIRYSSKRNSQPYYFPMFQSVYDDRSFINYDGETFDFALEPGYDRNGEIDIETYQYFSKGDTVISRWCSIDKASYDFWYSMEYDQNSTGGIFSQPIVISSNIEGGLGVWTGYGCNEYYFIIPE